MSRQESAVRIPVSAPGRGQHWRVAAVCLVLATITFAVFTQTLTHGFIPYDDELYVYENTHVEGGLSLKGLVWVFTHADCYLYHPLTMLSLMADYQLHGLRASGYHLTNVLLHTASVILLFLGLRQMTGALWRSAFVAAVFAIHPLRVESVAWVAERKDVLSAFFFMLTLGAYARYVRKPESPGRYLMVVLAFVPALLSKPTVVTLPCVLLLLDYWPLRRLERRYFSRLVLEKIPLLALAATVSVVTKMVVLALTRSVPTGPHDSKAARAGNALVSYVVYLRQMVWPEGLAVPYPHPRDGLPTWQVASAGILLAGLCAIAWRERRTRPWLLVGWLWYLGMLTPMIGIVQQNVFAHADRCTYLPQIGIYLGLTWLAAEWAGKWQASRAAIGAAMTAVIALLMLCAWTQAGYWKDDESFWSRTLAYTSDNDVAHVNLGAELVKKGNVDEAIFHYRKALEINPKNAQACFNLGNSLRKKGNMDEAITQYRTALEINPHYAQACNNLGTLFFQEERLQDAINQFQKALEIQPDYAEAHYNLGLALHTEGRLDEAIAHYEKALQVQPNYAECRYNLGNVFDQQGRLDEARAQFQEALRIKPGYAEAEENLGNAFLHMGNASEATTHFQKALELEPFDPSLQSNLAWLLAASPDATQRNGSKAVELAQQANHLTSGTNPIVLHALAAALAENGRFSEALDTAQRASNLATAQSNTDLAGQLHLEIKLYEAGSPYHFQVQPMQR
ncbi:MAG: tetratricopeptide repeat protein [Verrucomicrobiota bacterium]|jgi:tetratricopeptide (TPR) repeat protein